MMIAMPKIMHEFRIWDDTNFFASVHHFLMFNRNTVQLVCLTATQSGLGLIQLTH
jgi:hypothetical protein